MKSFTKASAMYKKIVFLSMLIINAVLAFAGSFQSANPSSIQSDVSALQQISNNSLGLLSTNLLLKNPGTELTPTTTPPGLQKENAIPSGLAKQGKTPSGWSKGKKKGWNKVKIKPDFK